MEKESAERILSCSQNNLEPRREEQKEWAGRIEQREYSTLNLNWWGYCYHRHQIPDRCSAPGPFLGVNQLSLAPECCLQTHSDWDWIPNLTVARTYSLLPPCFLARVQTNIKAESRSAIGICSTTDEVPCSWVTTWGKNEKELLGAGENPGWDRRPGWDSRTRLVLRSTAHSHDH